MQLIRESLRSVLQLIFLSGSSSRFQQPLLLLVLLLFGPPSCPINGVQNIPLRFIFIYYRQMEKVEIERINEINPH